MRVLFIAPSAYPLGGVQTWLDYLLPGLRRRGWHPILGLASGKHHDVERYLRTHPFTELIAIDNPTGSRVGRVNALVGAIREVKPSLLVSVNIGDCYAAIERMRAAGEKTPHLVMADHSLEPDYLLDAKKWRHVIDGFVATNQLTLRLATEYAGIDPLRVYYAPYGVAIPASHSESEKAVAQPIRIAYAGRVDDQQKRAQDILAILQTLELSGVAYQFKLAGDGPYLQVLREELLSQTVDGTVEFLGVLDPDALYRHLYDWAQVLLVTSFWETGPIVIWEAMAHGLPVVSSRYVGSCLEGGLQDTKNCLLFDIGDVSGAASQIGKMRDAALRTELVEQGLNLINTRYSVEHSIVAWDTSLRKILDKPTISFDGNMKGVELAGRLDHLLGADRGEAVRRFLGLSFRHGAAGCEWPHSNYALPTSHVDEFWAMAQAVDGS